MVTRSCIPVDTIGASTPGVKPCNKTSAAESKISGRMEPSLSAWVSSMSTKWSRTLPRRELIAHECVIQDPSACSFYRARSRCHGPARSVSIAATHLIGAHGCIGVQVQVDAVRQARELRRQRRRANVDVGGLDGRQIGRRRCGQALKGLVERDELGHKQVIPLAGRRRADGQRRGETYTHMRREALRDGIRQARAAHDALNGMNQFQVAQVLETIALAVANAQPKERWGYRSSAHSCAITHQYVLGMERGADSAAGARRASAIRRRDTLQRAAVLALEEAARAAGAHVLPG